MIEIKIRPIERYQVTYHSPETGCHQVVTGVTLPEAENIAGAVHARAEAHGMAVAPLNKTID